MTYRSLALGTVALMIAGVMLFVLLPSSLRSATSVALGIGTSGLVTAACVRTAQRIGFRDRLGVAWLLFGLCHLLLMITGLLVGDSTRSVLVKLTPVAEWTHNGLLFGVNLTGVIAFVLFARVWSGTGLVPAWRWQATIASVLVALAVAGHTTWNDMLLARAMHPAAIGNLVSELGDMISLSIIGPVAVTALALRGGALAWPWLLLTVSALAWLVYDVGGYFGQAEQIVELSAILSADLFALAAAVAQGMVVKQAGSEGRA